jgi:ABC-type transport system involved in multi-copper enzyme maturation permease subunit
LLLADLSTRERRSGTLNLLFSAPHLKTHYVWWKFSAALLLTLLILLIPALRLLWTNPAAALSMVTGAAFTAAFAVALGVMTGNPKAFVVLFLMFWYLALNDSGRSPGFDFAGWYGIATTSVRLKYFLLTLAALGLSHLFHQWHLKKNY